MPAPAHSLTVALLLVGLAPLASAQVFKCTMNGNTFYQQAPCEAQGMKGTRLALPSQASADTSAPAPSSSIRAPELPTQPAPITSHVSGVGTPPQKSLLETEADTCFAWYRPLLRDPNGAYYKEPYKDGRVVSITVYGTNGYGGYVSKTGSCELKDGKHDLAWTKIHAKRLFWGVE